MPEFIDPWLPEPDNPGDPVPRNRGAAGLTVYRVEGDPGSPPTLTELPNVRCVAIENHEGPNPGSAIFRYEFGTGDPDDPPDAATAVSTLATKQQYPNLVEVGDRLAVQGTRPDGETEWLFDGFPLTWSMAMDPSRETLTMAATGVAKRLNDDPIAGALVRDTSAPEKPKDFRTELVAQFNPRGRPNATPSTGDVSSGNLAYPTFLDPDVTGTDAAGEEYPRTWTLPMAAAYLCRTCNGDETYVKNMTRPQLDALLVARIPRAGVAFDPTDSSTYDEKDIAAADTPLTDTAFPATLHALVRDSGFGMRYALGEDSHGNPSTTLEMFQKQSTPVKPLLLQERGALLDLARTNTGRMELARDLAPVVNRWLVKGAMSRYEVSLVLGFGFKMDPADAEEANLETFRKTSPGFETGEAHDAYRLYIFGEDGSPTYIAGSGNRVFGGPTSLDSVFGAPDANGNPRYVARRRRPVGQLFTLDITGQPLSYKVAVSTDYNGPYPAVWNGTGHWQTASGGYELLKDRIGVRLNATDPDAWGIGQSTDPNAPFGGSGVVKVVQSLASADNENPTFYVRLTCVIEADDCLSAEAARQDTSPLSDAITRVIDARDRYARRVIDTSSEFNATGSDVVIRDDTPLATAEATAARQAAECGVFEGEVTIPWLTTAYGVGDRVSEVAGRGPGLRTDTGGQGYAPVLPSVVSVRWELDGQQRTVLTLSDAGTDRRRYARRPPPSAPPKRKPIDPKAVADRIREIRRAGPGVGGDRI